MFRQRLAAIRERLHDLEPCCPPGHVAGLADALDAIEAGLLALGMPGMTAPAVPVSDAELLAGLERVRRNLRVMLASGTAPSRRGAELALAATGQAIRETRRSARLKTIPDPGRASKTAGVSGAAPRGGGPVR